MNAFDFRAYARIPEIDRTQLPFQLDVRNFRHYTFRGVDFSEPSHLQALSDFAEAAIRKDRVVQRTAHGFLQKAGVVAHVKAFSAKRPGESFLPDYADLFYLYTYIRTCRPKRVLEYGSGISTLVMALALEQNGSGRLVALEPEEQWATATMVALPEPLRQHAEVIYSRGTSRQVDGVVTVCFADAPFANPDMIYIDGCPSGARFKGAENVAFLEKNLGSDAAIFIDGRWEAICFFEAPARTDRYEITSWTLDITSSTRPKTRMGIPFGLALFSNSMVRLRG